MKSDVPLIADGKKFRFYVVVYGKPDEKETCYQCRGSGTGGDGWHEAFETCDRCRGVGKIDGSHIYDDELEEHLKKCMDEFLDKKYVDKSKRGGIIEL